MALSGECVEKGLLKVTKPPTMTNFICLPTLESSIEFSLKLLILFSFEE